MIEELQKDINRETRQRIGAQLHETRIAKSMSLRELSEISGVDKNIICRIEAGRANTTLDTINALATALGLTVALIPSQS